MTAKFYLPVCLFLAACAYQPTEYQLTQLNSQAEIFKPDAAPIALDWWTQFNSKQLSELMQRLRVQNPDLAIAKQRIKKSRALLQQQLSTQWPTVNARAGQNSRYDFDRAQTSSGSSGSFSASYTVDLWGSRSAQNRLAELSLDNQKQSWRSALIQLQSNLASQYFNTLSLAQRVQISQENLQASESLLNLLQTQFEAGSASKIEVNQQRNTYISSQNQLARLVKDLEVSQRALAVLLGQPSLTIDLTVENIMDLAVPRIKGLQKAQVLTQRPDIQLAENQLWQADASLFVNKQKKWPTLGLSADLSLADLASLSSGWGASLAGSLSMPLFDAGNIDAQIEAAKTDVAIAQLNYQAVLLAAFADTLDTLADLQYQQQNHQYSAQQLDNNQSLYQLAKIRYDAGETDFINLLNAQRSWASARLDFASAKLALLQASVNLFSAVGSAPETTQEINNES
ncbi:TolC family protein [Gayadomonas joobiniege]|uniref:TolC family protein n=1 Tax=Gayadomonas joobiniege TaxID=1234606 RepID=UPI0003682C9C|nr:TolC family protein [Gayadomonas joobiniege]